MRRFLILLQLFLSFLSACTPTVILLTSELEPSPTTVAAVVLPSPVVRTPYPTPTRAHELGISPDALQGVKVLAWHGWDGSSASLFEQMTAEYNLSNKWGIKVTLGPQPNLTLLASAMELSLGKPEQPDLVVAMPEQILAWQAQVLDLSPYMAQTAFGLSPEDLPAGIGAQSLLGDIRYGLPAARSARFLFYNLSFARELGFASAPGTFTEFREQACAANAYWKQDTDLTNDGFGGLALETSPNWQTPYAWLVAGGGQVFNDGELIFNSPENVAALELVAGLRADDCAWLPDPASSFDHFAARRALFISGSLADLGEQAGAFSAAGSADEWSVLPFPGAKPGMVAYGPDYAVLKSTPARQLAAWLFIRWMLEPQQQARWTRATGLLPVTLPAIALLKLDKTLGPQWAAALELLPQAGSYPQTADWNLASKVFADGFISYFRSYPTIPLADVLEAMDMTVKDLTVK